MNIVLSGCWEINKTRKGNKDSSSFQELIPKMTIVLPSMPTGCDRAGFRCFAELWNFDNELGRERRHANRHSRNLWRILFEKDHEGVYSKDNQGVACGRWAEAYGRWAAGSSPSDQDWARVDDGALCSTRASRTCREFRRFRRIVKLLHQARKGGATQADIPGICDASCLKRTIKGYLYCRSSLFVYIPRIYP